MSNADHKRWLLPNWKAVLKRAWSIRLLLVAGLLSGIEAALPFITFIPIPQGYLALLAFIATGGAFITRLLAQKNMESSDG